METPQWSDIYLDGMDSWLMRSRGGNESRRIMVWWRESGVSRKPRCRVGPHRLEGVISRCHRPVF